MILTGKKGYGAFGFVILFIFLIIMWALVLGKMWSLAGDQAIASGETGIGAFFWSNLNLIFFFCLIIVAVVYTRYGGNS